MKKLITILFVLFSFGIWGQCSSEGEANEVCCEPDNYLELDNKGACYDGNFGDQGNICWKFSAPSTKVTTDIRGRYSYSCWLFCLCESSITDKTLYDKNCNKVSNGTEHNNLNAGETYYFCFSFELIGPDCEYIDKFCPYYIDRSSPLPVVLIGFDVKNVNDKNKIKWITATETNSSHFSLLRRNEGEENWNKVSHKKAQGNSNKRTIYAYTDTSYKKGVNYYKLVQVDFNGSSDTYGPIAVVNKERNKKIKKVINIYGQEVKKDHKGPKIIIYKDGTTEKIMN